MRERFSRINAGWAATLLALTLGPGVIAATIQITRGSIRPAPLLNALDSPEHYVDYSAYMDIRAVADGAAIDSPSFEVYDWADLVALDSDLARTPEAVAIGGKSGEARFRQLEYGSKLVIARSPGFVAEARGEISFARGYGSPPQELELAVARSLLVLNMTDCSVSFGILPMHLMGYEARRGWNYISRSVLEQYGAPAIGRLAGHATDRQVMPLRIGRLLILFAVPRGPQPSVSQLSIACQLEEISRGRHAMDRGAKVMEAPRTAWPCSTHEGRRYAAGVLNVRTTLPFTLVGVRMSCGCALAGRTDQFGELHAHLPEGAAIAMALQAFDQGGIDITGTDVRANTVAECRLSSTEARHAGPNAVAIGSLPDGIGPEDFRLLAQPPSHRFPTARSWIGGPVILPNLEPGAHAVLVSSNDGTAVWRAIAHVPPPRTIHAFGCRVDLHFTRIH